MIQKNEKKIKLKKPEKVKPKPTVNPKLIWTYTPEKGYHQVKENKK